MSYEVALGQSDSEPLVSDARVEKVFYQFQALTEIPDDTQLVTFIQEPSEKEPRRLAVFGVITPHPRKDQRAIQRPDIVTLSAMPYERFREMEANHRHYAGLTDPIRPIFAGVLRRHLKHYRTLKQNVEEAMN